MLYYAATRVFREYSLDLLEDIKDSWSSLMVLTVTAVVTQDRAYLLLHRGCSSMLNESLRVKCEKCDRKYDPLDP